MRWQAPAQFRPNQARLRRKGVDEIICVSVNDAHVMRLWGETSGATEAGITLLADADAEFTKALGLNYDKPDVGFYDRSRRYALVARGRRRHASPDRETGRAISTGEAFLTSSEPRGRFPSRKTYGNL
jgi:peroxiredoxin